MRHFQQISLAFFALSFLALVAGCGGGSSGNDDSVTVNTGQSGSLANVEFLPFPGSFISSSNSFVVEWPSGTTPPSSFSVSLHRYGEARGDAGRSDTTQKIDVSYLGGNQWNVKRRDNFSLDTDGVYYLRVTSPSGEVARSAYIVSSNRAQTTGRITRDIPTSGHGSLAGVEVTPFPGSVFIPRDTAFVVEWAPGYEAPPTLGIDIWRYEEARGGQPRKVSDQSINLSIDQDAHHYTVSLKNSDNNQLASGGVYFVELKGPGEVEDFAYIVSPD